jgi:hypothetical protein
MLSGPKRCQAPSHTSDRSVSSESSSWLSFHLHAQTNIMFELFLAAVCAADLTGQVHRRRTAGLTCLPARFMPFIVRAFSLFVSSFVAHSAPLAVMAAPSSSTRLQAAAL